MDHDCNVAHISKFIFRSREFPDLLTHTESQAIANSDARVLISGVKVSGMRQAEIAHVIRKN